MDSRLWSDYIMHHGIKGQKWGVKNGPPYPLKYDRPYNDEEVIKNYGEKIYNRLKKDPAHNFRMTTGIELIHKEPSKEELERIFNNWNKMTKEQQKISDEMCKKLFGMNNVEYYKYLINNAYKEA